MSKVTKQNSLLVVMLLSVLGFASQPAMAITETKTLTLTMNVKSATCTTVVVSAVNLNRQQASDIIAGTVSQPSTLSIDCTAGGSAPSDLMLRLIPARAHPSQGNDGVIQVAGRDDVGYRLLWGDGSVGTQGMGVPMDTELRFKSPLQANNDIRFDVKPIALNGATTLAPGNANTHVTIKVTYA
ncbi:fimbrial protein [Hafnia sp.]|uniref:fimbrial protein n=1 Tax=Hafnia sp. TaxID=1873498 RepID=UPI002FC6C536